MTVFFNHVVTILMHQDMLLYLQVVNCSYSFYDTMSKVSVPLSLGKIDLGATTLSASRSIHVYISGICIRAPCVICMVCLLTI
jgi:hypothetical protein